MDSVNRQTLDDDDTSGMRVELRKLFADEAAIDLLIDIWVVIQAWDDARDGDPIDDAEGAIRRAMVRIPSNPYYQPSGCLFLIKMMEWNWEAANFFEANKVQYEKAYMLRAFYYNIVLALFAYTNNGNVSPEQAANIWLLYGETFEDYKEDQLCQHLRQ